MMLDKDKKELLGRITKYIGKKITWLNEVEGWKVTEVAAACDIPLNRISEIKNYNKYQKPINESFLAAFIGGGIVTIAELKEKVNMSNEEKRYMDGMSFYGDSTVRKSIQGMKKAGVDVVPVLGAIKSAAEEGIDVLALIEEARKKNI